MNGCIKDWHEVIDCFITGFWYKVENDEEGEFGVECYNKTDGDNEGEDRATESDKGKNGDEANGVCEG